MSMIEKSLPHKSDTKKTLQDWLDEYSQSHQNPTNKMIHNICVPVIFLTSLGMLWDIPAPTELPYFNWMFIALLLVAAFYIRLSFNVTLGILAMSAVGIALLYAFDVMSILPVWQASLIVFAISWVLQFIGHILEGKKPSFMKDMQFLLIGPAWVVSHLYNKFGIKY